MKNSQQMIADIQEELDNLKSNLKGAISRSGESLTEKSKAWMDDAMDNFKTRVENITKAAKTQSKNIDETVHSNPWSAAGVALAVGFLAGFFLRRPSRE